MPKYIMAVEEFGELHKHIRDTFCECDSLSDVQEEMATRIDLAKEDVETGGTINLFVCKVVERCRVKKTPPRTRVTRRKG